MLVDLTSVLVRASIVTITTWQENLRLLTDAAEEFMFARWAVGELSPPHWDSEPMAVTLDAASRGLPSRPVLGRVLPDIVLRARAALARASQEGDRSFKLQRFISQALREALYPDNVHDLIMQRARTLCPEFPRAALYVDDLRAFMSKLSPAWSSAILKTWANAWTTSRRLHLGVPLQCVFGCSACADELIHYLHCPRLWRLLLLDSRRVAPADLEFPFELPSLAGRLLLYAPSHAAALSLVTAFLLYHSVRHLPLHAARGRNQALIREAAAARAHALSTSSPSTSRSLRPSIPRTPRTRPRTE